MSLEEHSMISAIEKVYLRRTERSGIAFRRAKKVLPGGNTRQSAFWNPYPLTIERASGCYVWDLDGHRYIDLANNYTTLVHGHAYPPILKAVKNRFREGTCWTASTLDQTILAEQITDRVPRADLVRFTNSGSEAANLALTIARTVTGREKVLMARYGYHGSLLEFESGHTNRPWPMTFLADYNDSESFIRVLDKHRDEIAAVFLEPVLGAGGIIAGERDFLCTVIEATREAGAVFVLDEVLTFRLALGGLQTELDIAPDLSMFGKFIGGGYPVGAVAGQCNLMQVLDPTQGHIFHSGTFNGNPVTMAAGVVSLQELTLERIQTMSMLADRFRRLLIDASLSLGLPLTVNQSSSIMQLYFSNDALLPSGHRDADQIMARFHLAALNRGLLVAPRGLIALSTVMTETVIDEAAECARAAMNDVANELS
ncbi:MAG: aminotransferase class III-fold pyridoxal phosphate-dependent enzyme [Gammaproteobacteria bacterium]